MGTSAVPQVRRQRFLRTCWLQGRAILKTRVVVTSSRFAGCIGEISGTLADRIARKIGRVVVLFDGHPYALRLALSSIRELTPATDVQPEKCTSQMELDL
jgi:hypothetical protein